MSATAPAYMMIFRESTPEVYRSMSVEERRAALARWNGWCDDLVARGKLQSGNTLHDQARVVTGARGARVLDGPFAEAKELIGGYFLLSADSLEEATAIAGECPNLPYGATVEIRPIAQACHLARSLGMTTMREPAAL